MIYEAGFLKMRVYLTPYILDMQLAGVQSEALNIDAFIYRL